MKGSGIVTRRPLILQLINRPTASSSASSSKRNSETNLIDADAVETLANAKPGSTASNTDGDEWGEFLHLPGQKFYDFDKIRDEIVRDTNLKCGSVTYFINLISLIPLILYRTLEYHHSPLI